MFLSIERNANQAKRIVHPTRRVVEKRGLPSPQQETAECSYCGKANCKGDYLAYSCKAVKS